MPILPKQKRHLQTAREQKSPIIQEQKKQERDALLAKMRKEIINKKHETRTYTKENTEHIDESTNKFNIDILPTPQKRPILENNILFTTPIIGSLIDKEVLSDINKIKTPYKKKNANKNESNNSDYKPTINEKLGNVVLEGNRIISINSLKKMINEINNHLKNCKFDKKTNSSN